MKAERSEYFCRINHCFSVLLLCTIPFLSSCDGDTDQSRDGSVMLHWTAPALSVDGSLLDDLAGYRVRWGHESGRYDNARSVTGAETTSATVEGLSPGTYFFAVTAVDMSGNESTSSNEVEVLIQ